MQSVARPGGSVNPSDITSDITSYITSPIAYRQNDLPNVTRLSVRTIQRLRKTGEFPAPDRMVGRSPIWSAATVAAWLAPSTCGEV
jgi:predicted DNA-binding transcriptional regulator AlpA